MPTLEHLKAKHVLLVALALLLPSCSSPGAASNDPMRNAMGFAMQGQMAAHQTASMMAAGVSPPIAHAMSAPSMQVPRFPAFQPFAK